MLFPFRVSRHLRIGFWNLNGFNRSILGNKLKTNDFLSIINKHDIFALVETHATYETEMNISKFKHFTKCRNLFRGAIRIYIDKKNSLKESPTLRLKTNIKYGVDLIKLTSTSFCNDAMINVVSEKAKGYISRNSLFKPTKL